MKAAIAILIAGLVIAILLLWHGYNKGSNSSSALTPDSAVPSESGTTVASTPAANTDLAENDRSQELAPIPLAGVLVDEENGFWLTNKNCQVMPRGVQMFGGIELHLDGLLQLHGNGAERRGLKYRSKVVLPLAEHNLANRPFASLHLLGGSRFEATPDAMVAEIVWRYADGKVRRTPLLCQNHIRDWTRVPYEEPAHLPYAFAKVVWRAEDLSQAGQWVRLYRLSLANPEPAKKIRQLELTGVNGDGSLMIAAATLDPLPLGARPDDSPDLEPTDPVPPRYVEVRVQTPEAQPLPSAKLRVQVRERGSRQPSIRGLKTDAGGVGRVPYPPKDLDRLEVSASHEDYSSRKIVWDLTSGDTIPASYLLKLGASVQIGGVVVNESDLPVAGAKMAFHRFWRGGEDMQQKGEEADFPSRSVVTDLQGSWQLKGLPPELLDHIGFDVSHPDYMGTNITVGATAAIDQQLRAGTHKIILHAGLAVRGLVRDEGHRPIAGATVWAGRRNYRERQETMTDADGRFGFRNVTPGRVLFSVAASGHQPQTRDFDVQADMPEIIFQLVPGKVLRALVQNESGEPLPGTRVVLEGNGDIGRTYEFTTTTGSDGRFQWDGAPDEPLQFYFYKEGYEQLRNKRLDPETENVVTLRKQRQIQGIVLDAESGNPVTKFRVSAGRSMGALQFYANSHERKDYVNAQGQFTLSLSEHEQNAIRLEAEDYAEQTQNIPESENSTVAMEFRLKPSPALRGTVVLANGTPVPGAQVALIKEGPGSSGVSLYRGRLQKTGGEGKMAITDGAGQFTISSPPEGAMIVAVAEPGFGSATVEQVRANAVVVLQPFGRVEGVLKIAGAPASGYLLRFSPSLRGLPTDYDSFNTTTDEQGGFTFEQLPPGEGQIYRLVKAGANSTAYSHGTTARIEPGQTTYVTLGDSGAVIKGRVRWESQPNPVEELILYGSISSRMPSPPQFNTPAESRAFFSSSEWTSRITAQKRFSFPVNPDGSFTVDSVPPGSYTLSISATKSASQPGLSAPMMVGPRMFPIEVPDAANSQSVIDVGEILITPPDTPVSPKQGR